MGHAAVADDEPVAEERPSPGRIVDRGLRDHVWLLRCKMRGEPITEPACRRCGYFVAGLTEPKCPECGADLQRSGIIDPARVRPWPLRVIGIVLWTILVAVVAAPISDYVLPTYVLRSACMNLKRRSGERPPVVVHARSDESLEWRGRAASPPIVAISVSLWPNLESRSYFLDGEIYTRSGRCKLVRMKQTSPTSYSSDGPRESGVFEGQETILDWMDRCGFDPTDPVVIEEAEKILNIVNAGIHSDCATFASTVVQMPLQRFTVWDGSASPLKGRPVSFHVIAIGIWLVIWLAGMVLIGTLPARTIRRQRRTAAGRL